MPPVGAAIAGLLGTTGVVATTAALLPTAIAAGGTAAALAQGNSASKKASAAAQEQAKKQSALETEVNQRAANQESETNAINTRDQARRRQAGLAIGAGGRQDTILTGPLGAAGETSGKKTLLGS